MKLARLLFKPRWQSKDAATRRGAVTEAGDAELVAALPTIARTDADADVRLAALRRLNQYEAWRERSTADADASIRQTARAAYLAMLVGNGSGVPPLDRRIAELDTLAAEELERVALHAAHVELRGGALERVARTSLLVDVAVADADPKLRQIALARIADVDALARVAERTRKTDKLVSRLARERVEALRIAAGDSATIEARARLCCERIEALLARPRSERGSELLALDPLWAELADRAPKVLRERFESTRKFLLSDTAEAAVHRERLRDVRQRGIALLADRTAAGAALEAFVREANDAVVASAPDLPEREKVETLVVELTQRIASLAVERERAPEPTPAVVEPAVEEAAAEPPSAESVLAQAHIEAAVARTLADRQRHEEQQRALRRNFDELVIELEGQLEAGDLATAQATQTRIQTVLDGLPPVARHDKRYANAQARHAELKRWQRWSNNERRKQLCEAIEALPSAGLHPDAVANRVRDARLEWQQLDASESNEPNPFGKRFHALCNQVLKPAQGYFTKRDELRKTAQQDIEALLVEWEAPVADPVDWNALGARRREVSGTLRKLDGVEPRARKTLAQRLKNLAAAIDAQLDAHAADIEAAKRRLIAEAERNAANGDAAAAAREVRDLQARWKAIGNGRRRTDEAQWKEFRAHCDAVFGKLDANRREREQRDADAKQAALDVVAALEQVAAGGDAQRAARRDIEQRWNELGVRDRDLERRWQTAQETLDRQARDADRARRQATFHDALARLALCEAAERGDVNGAADRWQTLGSVPEPLATTLQKRYDAALAGTRNAFADDQDDAARDVLVELEFLGAIETPESDRKRRMDLQVARLSKRMSGGGGGARAPRDELIALLARWVALGVASAPLRERFDRAFRAGLATLP